MDVLGLDVTLKIITTKEGVVKIRNSPEETLKWALGIFNLAGAGKLEIDFSKKEEMPAIVKEFWTDIKTLGRTAAKDKLLGTGYVSKAKGVYNLLGMKNEAQSYKHDFMITHVDASKVSTALTANMDSYMGYERFFYDDNHGWVDFAHVVGSGLATLYEGGDGGIAAGFFYEYQQSKGADKDAHWSFEDWHGYEIGREFGLAVREKYKDKGKIKIDFLKEFEEYWLGKYDSDKKLDVKGVGTWSYSITKGKELEEMTNALNRYEPLKFRSYQVIPFGLDEKDKVTNAPI